MNEAKLPEEPLHLFCDGVKVVTNEEGFLLALRSGGDLEAFIFTPQHAKRLLLAITDQIEKYEKTYGIIKASLAPKSMLSPLQKEDLDGGKE